MRILENRTPHKIKIVGKNIITIPTCGEVARCEEVILNEYEEGGIIYRQVGYGEVIGLPSPDKADCPYCYQIGGVSQFDASCQEHESSGVYARTFIVSAMVRQALPHRTDLVSPGKLIRNKEGQPIGCDGLIENSSPSK